MSVAHLQMPPMRFVGFQQWDSKVQRSISSSLGGQKAGLDFCWCWVWFPSPAGQGTNSTPQSTAVPSSFPNSCSLLCPPQQTPKHNIDAQGGLEGPKQTLAPERLIIYKWTAVDKKIRACVAGIQPWYAWNRLSPVGNKAAGPARWALS